MDDFVHLCSYLCLPEMFDAFISIKLTNSDIELDSINKHTQN